MVATLKHWGSEFAASFSRTYIRESRWLMLLKGLKATLIITLFSAIIGTILAFPICFISRSKNKICAKIGKAYVSFFQGTPILVILMLLYYLVFAKSDIDGIYVAIIGFSLNFAAYAGEMLLAGVDSIPKGQIEASLALGFSQFQTFMRIILPQAVRQMLPIYRGELINMLKNTSVVGYIAIHDLTKMTDIIRSRTYEAFFPLLSTALIYAIIAWILACALSYWGKRLDPKSREYKVPKESEILHSR